jgi:hypothetical protein
VIEIKALLAEAAAHLPEPVAAEREAQVRRIRDVVGGGE